MRDTWWWTNIGPEPDEPGRPGDPKRKVIDATKVTDVKQLHALFR